MAAFECLKRHRDKTCSAVDCLSFVVMEKHGITEALAIDDDFTHRFTARPGLARSSHAPRAQPEPARRRGLEAHSVRLGRTGSACVSHPGLVTAPAITLLRDARSPAPDVRDATEEKAHDAPRRDEPWRVLLHNDDYTPAEYVVAVLREVFRLGLFKATTAMLRAHLAGVAPVGLFPKDEAQRLIAAAHDRARSDGWPLRFSAEPGEAG
jgi:ATP-dependent Clp protease adaptor protein ClpS